MSAAPMTHFKFPLMSAATTVRAELHVMLKQHDSPITCLGEETEKKKKKGIVFLHKTKEFESAQRCFPQ